MLYRHTGNEDSAQPLAEVCRKCWRHESFFQNDITLLLERSVDWLLVAKLNTPLLPTKLCLAGNHLSHSSQCDRGFVCSVLFYGLGLNSDLSEGHVILINWQAGLGFLFVSSGKANRHMEMISPMSASPSHSLYTFCICPFVRHTIMYLPAIAEDIRIPWIPLPLDIFATCSS